MRVANCSRRIPDCCGPVRRYRCEPTVQQPYSPTRGCAMDRFGSNATSPADTTRRPMSGLCRKRRLAVRQQNVATGHGTKADMTRCLRDIRLSLESPSLEAASTNEQVSAVDNYLFSARLPWTTSTRIPSFTHGSYKLDQAASYDSNFGNDELVMIRRRERPDVDRLAHGQVAGVVGMEVVPRQLGELAVGQVLRLHVAGRRV